MTARAASAAIPIVAILGFSSGLCSQPAKTPTLGEILRRLEANLSRYDTGLPSIFCDEHAVSRVIPTVRDQDTVTQSIFRVKRMPNPDHTTTLSSRARPRRLTASQRLRRKSTALPC
jgi:hypothetical protein